MMCLRTTILLKSRFSGDGTFQPAVGYPTGGAMSEAGTVADLNGDGRLDLVVASGLNRVSVLLQTTMLRSQGKLELSDSIDRFHEHCTVTLTNSGGPNLTISTIAANGDFLQTSSCGPGFSVPDWGVATSVKRHFLGGQRGRSRRVS